mmetsp:Transcript_18737/g.61538  ORF Transcript_18737/g.61538 Transcript_18737/m.61538 type:complete len:126 (-) Transcript_18737:24-401(-)
MLLEIAQNLRSSSSDDSEADMPGIDFSRRESSFSHGFTDYDQEEVGCSSDCKQVGRLTAALLCIADTVRRCFLSKSRERRKKVCEPTGQPSHGHHKESDSRVLKVKSKIPHGENFGREKTARTKP